MDVGVHLPLMSFRGEALTPERLTATVDAAVAFGFSAVAANDHFVFQTPWLDGPTALASVIERSGGLELATTVSLATLRGPMALAKQFAAIDLLSGGRLTATLGPGSSRGDYEALGIDFEQRWSRLDEAVIAIRALLAGQPIPQGLGHYPIPPDTVLEPAGAHAIPLWIGSWGSAAGLRRVARLADGWLASGYNTTPADFATARERLGENLESNGRPASEFPNALATMWTWIGDQPEAQRVLSDVLAPLLRREPDDLRNRVCVGTPDHCIELLSSYAAAGCQRVYLWPIGNEPEQLQRIASEVLPFV